MFSKYIPEYNLIKKFIETMDSEFDRGLNSDQSLFLYSPIKMLPTFIHDVPSGREEGNFFAVDLGGTNLRIFKLCLHKNGMSSSLEIYHVPSIIMSGTHEDLFDFLALSIKKSFEKWNHDLKEEIDCLGFTFSFPCRQIALDSAILLKWTKGFIVQGVVNQDVVKMLREACERIHLKIKDFALINDTTGTLLSGAYEDQDVVIGVINGTGTNACYIEDITRVLKWSGPMTKKQLLINTEWGGFGDGGEIDFLRTSVDKIIDKQSVNPEQQIFEKMVSGMYLGELVRLALLEASENVIIFERGIPEKLNEQYSFTAAMVSLSYFKEEFVHNFNLIYNYLLSEKEYDIIYEACDALSRRAGILMGAGIVALVKRVQRDRCVVAVDGSMFRRHSAFFRYVEATISEFTSKETKITITNDGSGKGAALAAAVAITEKEKLENNNHIDKTVLN